MTEKTAEKIPPNADIIVQKPQFQRQIGRGSKRSTRPVDRRKALFKAVKAWRSRMLAAQGGKEPSFPRLELLDVTAKLAIHLQRIDDYLLSAASIVNHRRRSAIPLLEQRQRLAEALTKQLQLLGLDPTASDANNTLPESWITKVMPPNETEEEKNAKPDTT